MSEWMSECVRVHLCILPYHNQKSKHIKFKCTYVLMSSGWFGFEAAFISASHFGGKVNRILENIRRLWKTENPISKCSAECKVFAFNNEPYSFMYIYTFHIIISKFIHVTCVKCMHTRHLRWAVCVHAYMWLCERWQKKTSFQCSGCRSNPFEVNCLLFRAPFAFIRVMFHFLMIYRCADWVLMLLLQLLFVVVVGVVVCCFSCMCHLHNIPMNGDIYVCIYKEQEIFFLLYMKCK